MIITNKGKKYYSSSEIYQITTQKSLLNSKLGTGEKLEVRFSSINENDSVPDALLLLTTNTNKGFLTLEVKAVNANKNQIGIKEIQPLVIDEKRNNCLRFQGSIENVSCL